MENNSQNTENIEIIEPISDSKPIDDKSQGENLEANTEGQKDIGEQILEEIEKEEKLHTQKELDEIINKRLSRQSKKHQEELEQIQQQYKERVEVLELKYNALDSEYKTYKLDIEFQKEQQQLIKLGIPKEAINSLKAIKQTGDIKTYSTLREILVKERLRGKIPMVSTSNNNMVNTKKVSFLD